MKKYLKNFRKIKFSALFFCYLIFSTPSFSQSASEQQNIINQQNQIIQNQQQTEREKERQKELSEVKKEQQKIELEEQFGIEKNDGKIVQDLRTIQCFRINKIEFSENKILSRWQENSLTKKYRGQCLTIAQISEIGKEITNYLVEEGFVTSRVEIPSQSLLDGVLKINVIESYLENIIFNEDKFFDKTQKFTAFGPTGDLSENNKILNLHKIELGVDQINRLASNSASVKLIPGNRADSSIVAVENHPQRTSRISLSHDNYGNKTTGSRRETTSFSQDNLLHLNDSFNISRTSNDLDSNRDKGRSTSFSNSFSVPFKQHLLTLNYSRSSYFFITGDDDTPFRIYGKTLTKSASLDSILIKNKKLKTSSNFSITSRYNQNFNNDEKQYVSSRKASYATLAIANTFFLNNASLYLKPSYSKALNILDAQKDPANIASKGAHGEFDIFKFYGNYSQRSQIPYFKTPFSYSLTFDSQLAKQELYGNDKFSVGGVYSVRGFRNGSISDDSGYNIKNEFSFNLGQTILPHVDMQKASPSLAYLNQIALTPFYDYGFVRSKGNRESGRLSGGGIKASVNYKSVTASLTFARTISKSQLLLQHKSENSAVYFDINTEFGFF